MHKVFTEYCWILNAEKYIPGAKCNRRGIQLCHNSFVHALMSILKPKKCEIQESEVLQGWEIELALSCTGDLG